MKHFKLLEWALWKPGRIASVVILVVILILSPGAATDALRQFEVSIPIPTQSDWTDYGPIFEAGELGEWDYILWGGFAGSIVKKAGTYYLYYQGSSGYQLIPDETVTWRTIGAATSPDGINFTKNNDNPIITWFPNDDGEEGAASGGAALDENGEIVVYYGANTAISAVLVNADGRLTASTDGLNFTDQGVALNHQNSALWGSGDELFPIIAFQEGDQWFIYYIPNGTLQQRKLGVAWGKNRLNPNHSAGAASGGQAIQAWGMGSSAKVGPDTYALFLNDVTKALTEVRIVSVNAPDQLSSPVETYQFDGIQQTVVFLDDETNTWFMYYRAPDSYGVKLAPAGTPDGTPPTAPVGVVAKPINEQQVDLAWNPAADTETGIVLYNVFRDGVKIATVKGWNFSDTPLNEQTEHTYQISAVNYHGLEGPKSTPIKITTLMDSHSPEIVSVTTGSNPNQVRLVFNEPMEQSSAELNTNYTVNNGIIVTDAALEQDLKTVVLTTLAHVDGKYQLTIRNVKDRAKMSNSIEPNTTIDYLFTGINGLIGAWPFDEVTGETAFDLANHGNHGALTYLIKPDLVKAGPTRVPGVSEQGLQFDGTDDQVTIQGVGLLADVTSSSHTLAVWVNPELVPPGNTANDTSYSLLVRKYSGLYYDQSQKFKAEIQLSDGNRLSLESGVFAPGIWHHVTMVVDDTNKKLHLYVDADEVNGSPISYAGTLADYADAPYYFGTSEPLTNNYEYRLKGKLDEGRIFNQPLTSAEVQALFDWVPTIPIRLPIYLPILIKPN